MGEKWAGAGGKVLQVPQGETQNIGVCGDLWGSADAK